MSNTRKTCTAIIVAAGDSSRMGKNTNKQFLLIDEKPILLHTLLRFEAAKSIDSILLVTKPENFALIEGLKENFNITKLKAVIPGGKTRGESVLCGLNQIKDPSFVAIHDGARPFVSSDLIDRTVSAAFEYGAAAPGVIPKDTVKITNSENLIMSTPERETLRLIQTPQVFDAKELKLAYKFAKETNFSGTDDCLIMEHMGKNPHIVDGEYTNIKVTTPEDLPIAKAIFDFLKK